MEEIIKVVMALAFVLLLMGGLAFVLKKIGLAGALPQNIAKRRRLALVESLPLDARRRLVIIQRDDVQHLVILGASGETVIETGIKPPAPEALLAPEEMHSAQKTA